MPYSADSWVAIATAGPVIGLALTSQVPRWASAGIEMGGRAPQDDKSRTSRGQRLKRSDEMITMGAVALTVFLMNLAATISALLSLRLGHDVFSTAWLVSLVFVGAGGLGVVWFAFKEVSIRQRLRLADELPPHS